jgi:phenylalanyl-tRNA synthetase beta chain
VTIPTYRRDLERPVDLIEEVARLHGLEKFPETLPTGPGGGWSIEQGRHRRLRRLLTGAGLSQAVNLSFAGLDDLDSFAFPADHEGRMTIAVKNPLNDEMAVLRTSLLPGLLRALGYNVSRGASDVALFETGRVFLARPWEDDRRVPAQPERLGFAICGDFGPGGIEAQARPADVYTATAVWRLLASGLGLTAVELRQAAAPGFHPGRTAEVLVRGLSIGLIGELHPTTAAAYGINGRVAAGELEVNALISAVGHWQLDQPSVYPAVSFDLAFEVPTGMAAADLVAASANAEMLETVEVFDQYQGSSVGEGNKSLALRFVFRATDHTLATDEIAALRKSLIAAAASVGAVLRGGQ